MDNELLKMSFLERKRKLRGATIFALCMIAVLMIGAAMAFVGYIAGNDASLYWWTGVAFTAGLMAFITGLYLLGFE